MVTSNPGDLLSRCWPRQIGRLLPAVLPTLPFSARGTADVWSQIVTATEREVLLVVVGGKPRYGDAGVMAAAGAAPSTTVRVSEGDDLAISDPKNKDKAWSWTDITSRLETLRKNPAAALRLAQGSRRTYAGPATAADAPLELTLDMPSGGAATLAGQLAQHRQK